MSDPCSFPDVMQALLAVGNPAPGSNYVASIQTFVKTLALHTRADMVAVFEMTGRDTFNHSFLYNTANDSFDCPHTDGYRLSDYPQLAAAVRDRKAILEESIDHLRTDSPRDYAFHSRIGTRGFIMSPSVHENDISGFVVMRNPDFAASRQLIDSLPVIGAYLGSVRMNFSRQESLSQLEQLLLRDGSVLHKEQGFLNVLCRDYTSIYYVDLNTDTLEPLKIERSANAAAINELKAETPLSASALIRQYGETYVLPASQQTFFAALDPAHIAAELAHSERFVFRYQSHPNLVGQQYFEGQVVRFLAGGYDGKVFVGFRHIDDVVAQEREIEAVRTRTIAQLRAQNDVLSALGKIYFAILAIDLDRDVYEEISADSAIHSLTGSRGCASAEMTELCSKFAVPEYREQLLQFYDLSTLSDRLQTDETTAAEYMTLTGDWHTARFIAQRRDADGRVTHALYVLRIISDVKRRERNWIAIAEDASRASKAKTEFMSQLAHDIRTPLNAIAGFTTIAQAHLDDPQRLADALEKIHSSESFLQELVNNSLDIAQIENGKLELHPERTDLEALFAQLRLSMDQAAAKKELRVQYDLHDIHERFVTVDAVRLKQICTNLMTNAIKYTPNGGTVTFEAFEAPADSGSVRFTVLVRDTGIGMSKEFLDQMYSMFTRETDTRVNKIQGYGLGLSIVKRLTDCMDGKIDVDSKPGKGTTFRVAFTLPVCGDAPDDGRQQAQSAAAACRGMHLLVAEDNDLNYEVISELLLMYGIDCERAENGSVCVEKFQSAAPGQYDAILMDMQMPVMNGLQATAILRSLEEHEARSVPIIAMTANAFKEDVQRCLNAGMNAHLAKPVDVNQLLQTLAGILHK